MSDRPSGGPERRALSAVAPPAAVQLATISPGELLAEHLSGKGARVVEDGRRMLVARGMPFATVGADPATITPVCAVSARDLPVVDVLAALAAQDPTGVLVIEAPDDAFAFEVDRGRLTGARGLGPLDQLEPFVAEVHRRHPQRFGPDEAIGRDHPAWMKVARAFVEERVLDQLTSSRVPGTRMTLIRGDVEWVGTRLPPGIGPTLGHVLLEHARRFDELPKVLDVIGDLDRVAVPLAEPGDRPAPPPRSESGDDWDFFSDPDPAALAEWDDAVAMWSLCDGESSLREVLDAAMLGRFRGLLALRTLATARCIVLIDPLPVPKRAADAPASAAADSVAAVIPLRTAIENDPSPAASQTGYSIVARRAPTRAGLVDRAAKPAVPQAVAASRRAASSAPKSSAPPPSATSPAAPPPTPPEAAPPPSGDAGASTSRAARSRAAARVLDGALPSPTTVMVVLGATGMLALVASLAALL